MAVVFAALAKARPADEPYKERRHSRNRTHGVGTNGAAANFMFLFTEGLLGYSR